MKKKLLTGLAMAVIGTAFAAGSASAITLTFDDVWSGGYAEDGSGLIATDGYSLTTTADSDDGYIADGYGGLNWSQFVYLDTTAGIYGGGYPNANVSGDYVAFNAYAQVGTVDDVAFQFTGAYFTAAWDDILNIGVTGYDQNNNVLHSTTITANDLGPTLYTFNWENLYSLSFTSLDGSHFAMDNFTINQCQMDPVPEPATMLLFGTGLAGLVGTARRRMRKE